MPRTGLCPNLAGEECNSTAMANGGEHACCTGQGTGIGLRDLCQLADLYSKYALLLTL